MVNAGIAGGAGPNHSLADAGTTVAEIYNVSKPVGQRWSNVADSQIPRLYHSVAFLTANATVRATTAKLNAVQCSLVSVMTVICMFCCRVHTICGYVSLPSKMTSKQPLIRMLVSRIWTNVPWLPRGARDTEVMHKRYVS